MKTATHFKVTRQEILDKYPILDYCRQHLSLKFERRGQNWFACCPFHGEKTASFCVFPDQHFKCFGCNKSGSVIDLHMDLKGMSARDVMEDLARGIAPGEFRPAPAPVRPEPPKPKLNVTALMREWAGQTKPEWIRNLAVELGVSYDSLVAMECVWAADYGSYAFPMRDGHGEPIGIRLRREDGSKFAVPGSRNGIFIPEMQPQSTVYLPEGPTDCAACLSLGLFAIARPSCNGSLDQIAIACKRLHVQRAVIIADNDDPGINGSLALQKFLHIPNVVVVPPAKDIREFLRLGGTKELIEGTIKNLVWKQPCLTR